MEDTQLQPERTEPKALTYVYEPKPNDACVVISFPSRDLPASYLGLVYSKWLHSLRYGNPVWSKVDSDRYYAEYHAHIEMLLSKPDSIVRLAVLQDDHDVVLGFCVSREDVLDYIHVQKDYRNNGIAKVLLPADITAFTNITGDGMRIWQSKPHYKKWKFINPFV